MDLGRAAEGDGGPNRVGLRKLGVPLEILDAQDRVLLCGRNLIVGHQRRNVAIGLDVQHFESRKLVEHVDLVALEPGTESVQINALQSTHGQRRSKDTWGM